MSPRAQPRLISVVMPVLDGAGTIRHQLDALREQDYRGPWELLVADCGSSDGTLQVLGAAGVPHRLINAHGHAHNRAARARNLGAHAAMGELLAFCDADDVVAPAWLSSLATAAQQGDLIAGTLDVHTLNPHSGDSRRRPSPIHSFLPSLSTANCAIWAEVFTDVGGFDEEHPGAEDRDLAWRAQLRGHTLRRAPPAIVAYRYRTTLGETVRQRFRWGLADARLYHDFAAHGMARTSVSSAAAWWLESIFTFPALAISEQRRRDWSLRVAQQAGHLVGSIRHRVLFP